MVKFRYFYVTNDYKKKKHHKSKYIDKRFEKSWFYSFSVFWGLSVIPGKFV